MASEYKIAIHIAGELEKSFGSSIQGAQQGIASLAGGKILGGIKTLGRVAVNSMVAAGAAIGAAGVYSVNTGREFEAAMSSTAATAETSRCGHGDGPHNIQDRYRKRTSARIYVLGRLERR